MIASHRKNFNDSFTEAKHLAYLTALNSHYPGALDFSVAETPIFIDKIFIDKVLATGNYITEQIQSPSFKKITEASLQNQPNTPNEAALPNCIVMDFALAINDNKEIVPALIELQGFPSLFAFEVLQDECIRNTYSIPAGFSPFLNGYSKGFVGYASHKTRHGVPHAEVCALGFPMRTNERFVWSHCSTDYFLFDRKNDSS